MRASRDVRAEVFALTVIAIGLFGYMLTQPWSEDGHEPGKRVAKQMIPFADALPVDARQSSVVPADRDFTAGVTQLQAGHAAKALESFKRFSARAPHVPEVQVNLGFTYLQLGRLTESEEAFQRALQLRPEQANAYYGLGLVYEEYNDLELARGAMRSFIHLADESDPFVRLAQSALWEWEQSPVERESASTD